MPLIRIATLLLLNAVALAAGCSPMPPPDLNIIDFAPDVTRYAWRPSDIFSDPRSIALAEAVQKGDLAQLDQLIADGADIHAEGKATLDQLGWALLIRNKTAFKYLLEKGADPNHLVVFNIPIVYLAARNGKDSEWLELLLKYKANPNVEFTADKDVAIVGAIYFADRAGQQKNIELLIRGGADLNHRDRLGCTPAACAMMHNRYDLAYQLLQAGTDFRLKDMHGYDLVYRVVSSDFRPGTEGWPWREKLIDFLVEKRADFSAVEKLLAVRDPKKLDIWNKHMAERAKAKK